jgi:hypothetical protein
MIIQNAHLECHNSMKSLQNLSSQATIDRKRDRHKPRDGQKKNSMSQKIIAQEQPPSHATGRQVNMWTQRYGSRGLYVDWRLRGMAQETYTWTPRAKGKRMCVYQ